MKKSVLLNRITEELSPSIHLTNSDDLPEILNMNKTKLMLTCEIHGEFIRDPTTLFRTGRDGCPTCNRVKGRAKQGVALLEIFKVEAPKKFNNKFTYDYSSFKGHRKPMKMSCPEHGEFWAEPSRHLHTFDAGGCPACGQVLKRTSKSDTDEEWFAKGKKAHNNKYEYLSITLIEDVSLTQHRRITYNCPVHGEQSQLLASHVFKGNGCIKCRNEQTSENYLRKPEDVIVEIESLFPGRLSFEKFEYSGGVDLFTLICKEHNAEFQTNMTNIRCHPEFYSCPKCSPMCDSFVQRLISNSIIEMGLPTIYNERKMLGGKEIDIYVPDLNLGIEYNGVYWHSERWHEKPKWHMIEKQQLAASKGIELVHFDSTIPGSKIINFIKFKAGKTEKVFARKTTAARVDQIAAESMLNELHLQKAVKGCTSYGLFKDGKLLGVASFSKASSERGNKNPLRWELRRMVFNCQVVGGASKLLKAFTRDHQEIECVISYSDNRWFTGDVYKALGFTHTKTCPPDYAYTRSDLIYHKSQFKHSAMKTRKNFNYDPKLTEVENCRANGYFRIWDCGKKKWELILNKEN